MASTKEPLQSRPFEARWPPVLVIIGAIVLMALLSARIRLFPVWLVYVLVAMALVPMVAVQLTKGRARWLAVERVTTLIFILIAGAATVANLANIVRAMMGQSAEITGTQLLASSIGIWVTNVLVFALLYWYIDRGGPEARISRLHVRPDWLFPQADAPAEDVPPDWRPTFVDYLFLGFATATAFSPTDALPLTSRAKLLMMLQSTISLATLAAVASRAINILGS
jgi:hypothetical protein